MGSMREMLYGKPHLVICRQAGLMMIPWSEVLRPGTDGRYLVGTGVGTYCRDSFTQHLGGCSIHPPILAQILGL